MGLKHLEEIKNLESRLVKTRSKLRDKKETAREIAADIRKINNSILGLESRIKELKKFEGPTVSEHAIIRYMERVMGIDVEELRGNILTDKLKSQIEQLGDGKYPINGGKVVVKGNTIVSIL